MRRFLILTVLLLFTAMSVSAVEGLFQINTVFQQNSYPLFGSGGKDVLRTSSAGIGLTSTRGTALQGVIDLYVLFPFRVMEKTYPATDFTDITTTGFPIGLDAVIGVGYRFDLDPLAFFVSTGFHTGALFQSGDYLVAFGVALNGQVYVRLTDTITVQTGVRAAFDFGGLQTFVSGADQFAGYPFSIGFFTGFGLYY